MRTIYKYILDLTDRQIINIPSGWTFLHIGSQGGYPCLWAMLDDSSAVELLPSTFLIFGTGHDVSSARADDYLGTAQVGQLVWHVFRGD